MKLQEHIGRWVSEIFRSSSSEGRLFRLPTPLCLANGESCSYIVAANYTRHRQNGFVKGLNLSFSTGLNRTDVCAVDYSLYWDASGELKHLIKSERSGTGQDLRIRSDNLFSDEKLTEIWRLQSCLAEVEEIRVALQSVKWERMPASHPLLNVYEVRAVKLGDDDCPEIGR